MSSIVYIALTFVWGCDTHRITEPVFNKCKASLPMAFPLCVVAPQLKASAFAIVASSLAKKPYRQSSIIFIEYRFRRGRFYD